MPIEVSSLRPFTVHLVCAMLRHHIYVRALSLTYVRSHDLWAFSASTYQMSQDRH